MCPSLAYLYPDPVNTIFILVQQMSEWACSRINPVVGCYEPPRPDPTAHMTEEQKEYEAMQLVNMMDKLHRYNIL